MTARTIIEKFGSQTALAKAIRKPQSTVQYWSRTGAIPFKWQSLVLEAARQKGIDLAPSDFAAVVAESRPRAVSRAPVAKWPGLLTVGDQEVPVYVLEDGRRVISRTGALN